LVSLFGALAVASIMLSAAGINPVAAYGNMQMMPYIFTIVVLVISTMRLKKGVARQPASLGSPYDREDRA
jgi:simple sugar transport system permease protein